MLANKDGYGSIEVLDEREVICSDIRFSLVGFVARQFVVLFLF